jgi:hypothetical protein
MPDQPTAPMNSTHHLYLLYAGFTFLVPFAEGHAAVILFVFNHVHMAFVFFGGGDSSAGGARGGIFRRALMVRGCFSHRTHTSHKYDFPPISLALLFVSTTLFLRCTPASKSNLDREKSHRATGGVE